MGGNGGGKTFRKLLCPKWALENGNVRGSQQDRQGAIVGCNLGALESRLTSGSPSSDAYGPSLFLFPNRTARSRQNKRDLFMDQMEKVFRSGGFISRLLVIKFIGLNSFRTKLVHNGRKTNYSSANFH